ncbi:MAG: hypothetical protein ABSB19_05575 [Methylomonas sp.]
MIDPGILTTGTVTVENDSVFATPISGDISVNNLNIDNSSVEFTGGAVSVASSIDITNSFVDIQGAADTNGNATIWSKAFLDLDGASMTAFEYRVYGQLNLNGNLESSSSITGRIILDGGVLSYSDYYSNGYQISNELDLSNTVQVQADSYIVAGTGDTLKLLNPVVGLGNLIINSSAGPLYAPSGVGGTVDFDYSYPSLHSRAISVAQNAAISASTATSAANSSSAAPSSSSAVPYFSGNITIAGGTLELGVSGDIGSGSITFENNARLVLDSGVTLAASNVLYGFQAGLNKIVVRGFGAGTTETFVNNVLTLTNAQGQTQTLNFDPAANFSGVTIQQTGNDAATAVTWTNDSLSGANNGIYAGDLGLSGQTAAAGQIAQEISGNDAVRFNFSNLENQATVDLSRLVLNQGVADAGRLRAFDNGVLVGETDFFANSASGQLRISLNTDQGFNSLVFTAGAYNAQNQFVAGALDNASGQFLSAPYQDQTGLHGGEYLLHMVLVGVAQPLPVG